MATEIQFPYALDIAMTAAMRATAEAGLIARYENILDLFTVEPQRTDQAISCWVFYVFSKAGKKLKVFDVAVCPSDSMIALQAVEDAELLINAFVDWSAPHVVGASDSEMPISLFPGYMGYMIGMLSGLSAMSVERGMRVTLSKFEFECIDKQENRKYSVNLYKDIFRKLH